MRALIVSGLAGMVMAPAAALAIDHKNLEEGRPLRFEDA